ncbi:MAG: type II secretion system ATPase GspE [bacterium]
MFLARKYLLGNLLIEQNKINDLDLQKALSYQKEYGGKLGKVLVDMGVLSEEEMCKILSHQLGLPFLSSIDFPQSINYDLKWSTPYMRQYKFFPFELVEGVLTIAMADPLDLLTIDDIRLFSKAKIKICISTESDIMEAVEKQFGEGSTTMERIVGDIGDDDVDLAELNEDADIDHLRDMAHEAPVIKLVNLVIAKAIDEGASDIHIEPYEDKLKIRYRIDGVLYDTESPPKKFQAAVISRIKIMAEMNIAERRLPQDGRIRSRVAGKKVDLRVSTLPTLHGESVVMRILDRSSVMITLDELGFPVSCRGQFEALIKKPHGIILVTGPTGSGKTTTLYGALDKINTPDKKIITVEDPVEYQLSGINQIQVKAKIGLTFSSGLRSIVRQDPDIMMVGEIRDLETAEIAIQSALTGHLVFSTLHTNDAPGGITRLLDMGVESYLAASCLEGILAQRLVRHVCPHCKKPFKPDARTVRLMNLKADEEITFYKGEGCPECKFTGYKGRSGIFELLIITEEIKSLILRKATASQIKQLAVQKGMVSLREDGWAKVKAGKTSLDEVLRVTQEEGLDGLMD